MAGVLVAGVVASVVLLPLTTRYFRASISSFEGSQKLYTSGDVEGALDDFSNATKLAPWDGFYVSQLADVQLRAGRNFEARLSLLKAAERNHYSGAIGPDIAVSLVNLGFPDEGLDVAAQTLKADPHAPSVIAAVTEVFEFVRDQDAYDASIRRRASSLLAQM